MTKRTSSGPRGQRDGKYYMCYSARWNVRTMPPAERSLRWPPPPTGDLDQGGDCPPLGGRASPGIARWAPPHVLYQDGQFLMWYQGIAPSGEIPSGRIGFATSTERPHLHPLCRQPHPLARHESRRLALQGVRPRLRWTWDGTRSPACGSPCRLSDGNTQAFRLCRLGARLAHPMDSPTPPRCCRRAPRAEPLDGGRPHPPSAVKVGSEWVMYYEGYDRWPSLSAPHLDRRGAILRWAQLVQVSGNPVVDAGPGTRSAHPTVLYDPVDPEGKVWRMWYFDLAPPGQTWNDIIGCWSPDGYN